MATSVPSGLLLLVSSRQLPHLVRFYRMRGGEAYVAHTGILRIRRAKRAARLLRAARPSAPPVDPLARETRSFLSGDPD